MSFAEELIARHSPETPKNPSLGTHQVSGHWVDVLLQMEYEELQGDLFEAEIAERDVFGVAEPYINRLLQLWETYASLAGRARFLSTRPGALKRMISGLLCEHFSDTENMCAGFTATAQHRAEAWNIQVEATSQRVQLDTSEKSMEMAQLSINESRSAIALTILAFAFVPISLASSVFGMNVQEINQSGHSIWVFVLTSVLLVLLAVWAWLLWRSIRNWRQISEAVKRRYSQGDTVWRVGSLRLPLGFNRLVMAWRLLELLWLSHTMSWPRKLALAIGVSLVQKEDIDGFVGKIEFPEVPGEAYRNPALFQQR